MPRTPKAKSTPKDSSVNLGFGVGGCKSVGANRPWQSNPAPRRPAIMNLVRRCIEADFGPPAMAGPDTFRRDLHPDPALRDADSGFATAMRDSAITKAKPDGRACRKQNNPMPFNDSDWFRKDDDPASRDWQPSGARSTAKGSPNGERGGVHQFGVPPKGNANFAWVQHFSPSLRFLSETPI